ncbi:hypothetical protein [Rhodoblastus sp.]|uniref:hypothetical protein n=1 Tax=Rhodoblastus sp. TaxID=1962975 RepID=UPI002639D545|nr:hypothetical protein [Rhodoblastus sp.]
MTDVTCCTPADAVRVGEAPADLPQRRLILRLLANAPMVANIAQKLSAGDVFRVVISRENMHLFKQAADGSYKPYLHNGKHIVENVDLMRVAPDYFGMLSNVVLTVSMHAISAKLDSIEASVQDIDRLIVDTQRSRLKGALNALAMARQFSDRGERRREMISAGQDIAREIGALSGQLRAHIATMPTETTGWFDGFFGNGFDDADAAFSEVKDDVGLLSHCVGALLQSYLELGEPAVANEAIRRIVDDLREAGLPDAIRKARLLPFPKDGEPAEQFLGSFFDAVKLMDTNLLESDRSRPAVIFMDIKPEDFAT